MVKVKRWWLLFLLWKHTTTLFNMETLHYYYVLLWSYIAPCNAARSSFPEICSHEFCIHIWVYLYFWAKFYSCFGSFLKSVCSTQATQTMISLTSPWGFIWVSVKRRVWICYEYAVSFLLCRVSPWKYLL